MRNSPRGPFSCCGLFSGARPPSARERNRRKRFGPVTRPPADRITPSAFRRHARVPPEKGGPLRGPLPDTGHALPHPGIARPHGTPAVRVFRPPMRRAPRENRKRPRNPAVSARTSDAWIERTFPNDPAAQGRDTSRKRPRAPALPTFRGRFTGKGAFLIKITPLPCLSDTRSYNRRRAFRILYVNYKKTFRRFLPKS